MSARRSLLGILLAGAALLTGAPRTAHAMSPYLETPPHDEAVATPAYRYANMSNEEAYAELERRGIPFERAEDVGTVRAPIRLKGKLHGVDIHGSLPANQRTSGVGAKFEILDARLALSLDDFTAILARHDIVELVHFTMYRPNVDPPGTAGTGKADKSEKAEKPGKSEKPSKAEKPGKAEKPSKAEKPTKGDKSEKAAPKKKPGKHKKVALELEGASYEVASFDRTVETVESEVETDAMESAKQVTTSSKSKSAPSHDSKKLGGARSAAKGTPGKTSKKPPEQKEKPQDDDDQPHGKWAPPGTRHPAGLAIDVGVLKKADGTTLSVASNFEGTIGQRTCGATAPEPSSAAARELRAIVCEAHDKGIFTYTLTPNYNADHADHFHMEIKPGVEWFLYH
ncbi:MAG: extensin family protein [Polyangiaceae bacterium]